MSQTSTSRAPSSGQTVFRKGPAPSPSRVAAVLAMMEAKRRLGAGVIAIKLLAGIPLCLIGPLLLSFVIYYVLIRAGRWDSLPSFGTTLLTLSIITVPLLLWYERRTRGEHLSEMLDGVGDSPDSYGEYRIDEAHLQGAAFIEMALTGPRLLWEVYDSVRGRAGLAPEQQQAAAVLVLELLGAGGGVPIRDLLSPARPPSVFGRLVKHLKHLDWIDIAEAGDKIWLLSRTRDQLIPVLRSIP